MELPYVIVSRRENLFTYESKEICNPEMEIGKGKFTFKVSTGGKNKVVLVCTTFTIVELRFKVLRPSTKDVLRICSNLPIKNTPKYNDSNPRFPHKTEITLLTDSVFFLPAESLVLCLCPYLQGLHSLWNYLGPNIRICTWGFLS